ncbi:MAG TPA: sugar ABC transporter ATP-binding protein [Acidimicrobiales bacterium]|nr:sugar ABC transporter ATP-binding protein [Acidimicrobiales bacterium]
MQLSPVAERSEQRGSDAPLLVLEDVVKVFPNGTVAVRGVSMTLGAGTVHGLVGANGAGKSTLIKIISGALARSSGRILWQGREVRWSSPSEPLRAGIATVHQHTPLVPTLSVTENVYLAGSGGGWRWSAAARQRQFLELLGRIDYHIDPSTTVSELSVGERQMVAMLKALAEGPLLLVLDEPTASLAHEERQLVYRTVLQLSAELGTTVLYVSHLLDEILQLTTQVTVLRDGRVVLDRPTAELDESILVRSIVGRDSRRTSTGSSAAARRDTPAVLEVEDLESPGKLSPSRLVVHRGEVVGIAGLLGSGRSELLQAIFGADPRASGTVKVAGRRVRLSPAAMVSAGLVMVPEDRSRQGLIPDWEIWRNISLPSLAHLSWQRLLPRRRLEIDRAEEAIARLSIKASSPYALVRELSGGNAQKVVFAKWLYAGVQVMLLDEPTAGIDIGAKRDIQELIRRLADEGLSVVIVDSELDELLLVSDRLLVMHRGVLIAERAAGETDEQELVALASGLGRPAAEERPA